MDSSKVVSHSLLILTVGIAVASAQKYTTITSDTVIEVNKLLQNGKTSIEKCAAEGIAVQQGLESFKETQEKFPQSQGTLFISCSTGFNGITLVQGEALRLKELKAENLKPANIIVAYTYNYANPIVLKRQEDMGLFMQAVFELTEAAKIHGITVTPRKLLVSVEELPNYYGDQSMAEKTKQYMDAQIQIIQDCEREDSIPNSTPMTLAQFRAAIIDAAVKMLYDGIVGSGSFPFKAETLVLTAIARAQISVMGQAINEHLQNDSASLCVLSNDSPSGMNVLGVWVVIFGFEGYPVHLLITYGWNKDLSNGSALEITEVRVLNPDYNGSTFLGNLKTMVKTLPEKSDNLTNDITQANEIKGSIAFKFDGVRMTPVAAVH